MQKMKKYLENASTFEYFLRCNFGFYLKLPV